MNQTLKPLLQKAHTRQPSQVLQQPKLVQPTIAKQDARLLSPARAARSTPPTMRTGFAAAQTHPQDVRFPLGVRDALSALPNAPLYRRRIALALQSAVELRRPMAIIAVALSNAGNWKEVFSPAEIRTVLATDAARLARAFHGHAIPHRSAMFEFSCGIADVADDAEFLSQLQKLHAALAAPIALADREVMVRAHIGVAICPFDGLTGESLAKRSAAAARRAMQKTQDVEYFSASEE